MKILTVDEMLSVAEDTAMPGAAIHARAIEAVTHLLAAAIADHLGVNHGGTAYERGFGGLAGSFGPKSDGQPCPPSFDEHDPGGDWDTV